MKIIIPGIPIPQARMRHSTFGGFTKTYDPNAKDKQRVRLIIEKQMRENLFPGEDCYNFEYPRVTFVFHMPLPMHLTKKNTEAYTSGFLKHVTKPDVDNLIKLYLDCLDGIVLHQDQKVSLGPSVKLYHPEPKTIVWINETRKMIQPFEMDFPFVDVSEYGISSLSECNCLCDCGNRYLPDDWRYLGKTSQNRA